MPINEAPCSKLQGIKRNCAEANPPSLYELRRGGLAIHPCSKLQGILAKANKEPSGIIEMKWRIMLRGHARKAGFDFELRFSRGGASPHYHGWWICYWPVFPLIRLRSNEDRLSR